MTFARSFWTCFFISFGFCFSACVLHDPAGGVDEERAAIRAVIAKETECYYRQDLRGWKETFVASSDFRMHAYWEGWPEKVKFYNGFESLLAEKAKQFEQKNTIWTNSIEVRENEVIRVSGDMAWYTFEQYSHEKESGRFLGKSLETRILEKQNGRWKIAYMGYHYFPLADSTKRINVAGTFTGWRSSARRSG